MYVYITEFTYVAVQVTTDTLFMITTKYKYLNFN